MKLKTFLVAATAGGIGYVLGTKAGRARFEQIRGQAQEFLKSPTVQDTVANLSDTVKQNAAKLPDPVANVVTAAADKVKGSTATSSAPDPATPDSPVASTAPTGTTNVESPFADAPITGATFSDPTFTDTTVTDPTVTDTIVTETTVTEPIAPPKTTPEQ